MVAPTTLRFSAMPEGVGKSILVDTATATLMLYGLTHPEWLVLTGMAANLLLWWVGFRIVR
jgi:hypothetical protein